MTETGFQRIRAALEAMIIETQAWEAEHRKNHRKIEVLACKMRLNGLLDLEKKVEQIAGEIEL